MGSQGLILGQIRSHLTNWRKLIINCFSYFAHEWGRATCRPNLGQKNGKIGYFQGFHFSSSALKSHNWHFIISAFVFKWKLKYFLKYIMFGYSGSKFGPILVEIDKKVAWMSTCSQPNFQNSSQSSFQP